MWYGYFWLTGLRFDELDALFTIIMGEELIISSYLLPIDSSYRLVTRNDLYDLLSARQKYLKNVAADEY